MDWTEEEALIASDADMTRDREVMEAFGQLVDHFGADNEGFSEVAGQLDVTIRILRNQYGKLQRGENISGEARARILWRIDKCELFGLEICDKRLAQSSLELRHILIKDIRSELIAELRKREQALDEREADLRRREETLAEKSKESEAAMSNYEKILDERRDDLDQSETDNIERRKEIGEREAEIKARAAEVKALAAAVKRREKAVSEWEIVRKALRPGGLLAPAPCKSLALAAAEFEERYQKEFAMSSNARDAEKIRLELDLRERTFNLSTAPLRWIIYKIVGMEVSKSH